MPFETEGGSESQYNIRCLVHGSMSNSESLFKTSCTDKYSEYLQN